MRKNLHHLRNLRDKLIFSGEEKDPREEKQESLRNLSKSEALHWKEAATYSPALHCSTIGASGLNFSVRNGKRWNPTAITTWYKVDYWLNKTVFVKLLFRCFVVLLSCGTTIQLKVWTWKKVFGQLVVLGFDVTVFTPAPYQRRSLRRPSMEFSSCGWLRT